MGCIEKALDVPLRRPAHRQQSLDLRREQNASGLDGVEQGLDAEPVPCSDQAAGAGVPENESKLAVEIGEAARAGVVI